MRWSEQALLELGRRHGRKLVDTHTPGLAQRVVGVDLCQVCRKDVLRRTGFAVEATMLRDKVGIGVVGLGVVVKVAPKRRSLTARDEQRP